MVEKPKERLRPNSSWPVTAFLNLQFCAGLAEHFRHITWNQVRRTLLSLAKILLIILGLLPSPLAAQSIDIAYLQGEVSINNQAKYFSSKEAISLDEALAVFKVKPTSLSNAKLSGYDDSFHWLMIPLSNSRDSIYQIQIKLSNRLLSQIDLMILDSSYQPHSSVEAIRIKHRVPKFQLQVEPGEEIILIFRLRFGLQKQLNLTLGPAQNLSETEETITFALQIFYGIFLSMILFNVLLFLVIRDVIFVWHVASACSLAASVFLIDGSAYPMLGQDHWNDWIAIFGNLAVATSVVFGIRFLDAKKSHILVHRLINFVVAFGFLSALLLTAGITKKWIYLTDINLILATGTAVGFGGFKAFTGQRSSRFYLIGLTLVSVGALIWLGTEYQLYSENAFTANALNFGLGLAMIVISLGLADQINHLKNALEDQNKSLEIVVEHRTHELRQKIAEINNILLNIQQGIFKVGTNLLAENEYSKHLEQILDTNAIAGRHFSDLVLDKSLLSLDEKEQILSVLHLSINQHYLSFEVNSNLLPIEIKSEHLGKLKILEVEWVPIIMNDTIESIMITLRDVSELRDLQEIARTKEQELKLIGEILNADRKKFRRLISENIQEFSSFQKKLNSKPVDMAMLISHLYRQLHTLKGNGRALGLTRLTSEIHVLEGDLKSISIDTPDATEKTSTIIENSIKAIHLYEQTLNGKLMAARDSDSEEPSSSWKKRLIALYKNICLQRQQDDSALNLALEFMDNDSLQSRILAMKSELPGLCEQLGKAPADLQMRGPDIYLPSNIVNLLEDCIRHCIRNSLDHGIETEDIRRNSGKAAHGEITITTDFHHEIVIELADDGQGINLQALRSKVDPDEKLQLSDEDLVQYIFQPRISTSKVETEVSGRGIGMDVVKHKIESIGGQVMLVPKKSDTQQGYYPFLLRLVLPGHLMLANPAELISKSAS